MSGSHGKIPKRLLSGALNSLPADIPFTFELFVFLCDEENNKAVQAELDSVVDVVIVHR